MSGASASIAAAPSVSTSSNAGNAHADSHDDGVDYGDGDGQDMNDEDPVGGLRMGSGRDCGSLTWSNQYANLDSMNVFIPTGP